MSRYNFFVCTNEGIPQKVIRVNNITRPKAQALAHQFLAAHCPTTGYIMFHIPGSNADNYLPHKGQGIRPCGDRAREMEKAAKRK